MSRRTVSALFALALAAFGSAQLIDQQIVDSLKWREIGPWRGGRSCAVSGVPGKPNDFYMGTCGGGLWKSTDAGQNWKCVSDGFFRTGSVGAVEVSMSNPDVVYVGMGETEVRGNISHGDGVYRSDDGGKTWRHLGLQAVQSISRVRIHPTNPDVAWVAAVGHFYGFGKDRGVYKTVDGGKTWRKTLFVSEKAGIGDLCLDPNNPQTIFASSWEVWRTPYSLNSGGPGSKMFKSTDAGESWQEISANQGLPKGPIGKIGISVSGADSNRVYAMIEAAAGGVYVSDDAGKTWALTSNDPNLRQRPWYYTRIYADPKTKDQVYVLNVAYGKSTNGGKSFSSGSAQHSDHHDCWIDPNDPTRIIMANDGGASVTVDGGRSWSEQDYPTAQFYHVSLDNMFPYHVLGAQQDNSTVRILSRTFGNGITGTDWTSTAGGESGWVAANPDDPDMVFGGSYGGSMDVTHHRYNTSRTLDPWPDNPMGHGAADLAHRFQWTYPIVFRPGSGKVLYTGSQYVLRSYDLGKSWQVVSPDLTTNDKTKQQSSGGPITQDNTSVEYYCTVFCIAESPKQNGVIWAGTDDGLVWVTRDDAKTWVNVTGAAFPKNGLISMVEASPHDPATAFVAVDNHENDDLKPYAFVTHDFGATWSPITKGMKLDSYVRVVRQDTVSPNVLYAGTETGAWLSTDSGATWQPLQSNLPVVPVHDLAVKGDELVAATHGRAFWILNGLSVLRQTKLGDQAALRLFDTEPTPVIAFGPVGGENVGKNPPSGLLVRFWSPTPAKEGTLELKDAEGRLWATKKLDAIVKGMNETTVSPRLPGYRTFAGARFWGAGTTGSLRAPAGDYAVTLTVGGTTRSGKLSIAPDPRSGDTVADSQRQFALASKVAAATNEANEAVLRCRAWREAITASFTGTDALAKLGAAATDQVQAIEDALYQGKAKSGQDLLNYPIRLNNRLAALFGSVQAGSYGPMAHDVYSRLRFDLDAELSKLREWEKTEVPKLNAALVAAGKPELAPKFQTLPGGGPTAQDVLREVLRMVG